MKPTKKKTVACPAALRLEAMLPVDAGILSQQADDWTDRSVERGTVGPLAAEHALWHNCLFRNVTFTDCRLHSAQLSDIRFEGCDLSNLALDGAALNRVEFVGCKLLGAALPDATLNHVRLERCNGRYLNLSGSRLRQVRFTECDLTEAALRAMIDRAVGHAAQHRVFAYAAARHRPQAVAARRPAADRRRPVGRYRRPEPGPRPAAAAGRRRPHPNRRRDRITMEIREITGNNRRYLPLLLVGDEQEEMVMRDLPHGSLFVCFDPDPCAVAVVTDEGDGCCELKNLAVEPCRQRQGYGRRMVAFVVRRYTARGYRTLRVGTGETPSTLSFYAQCGFRPAGRIPDFFTRNYDHPIVEEGVLLRDMILLEQPLGTE